MPVLIFGFEPFLEFEENPSQLIVESLNGRNLGGELVRGVVLPVAYDSVEDRIMAELEKEVPRLVLGVGFANGRSRVTPEKIAVNYRRTTKPDNSGKVLAGQRIDDSEPDGIFSNIDVKGLVDELNNKGIPSQLSLSAGSYICNNTMFVIVREARKRGFKGGFMHIPCHAEYVAKQQNKTGDASASLPLDFLKIAVEMSIAYLLRSPP